MKQDWEIKKLGEVCRIRTGKKDVNQGNPNGEYPFFTCAREHTFSDVYSFDTEAILIAGNGDVGNVSYYKGKFEAYQRTYVLSDFKNILPRFLFLVLDGSLKETLSKQKLGNTMPYIKLGMLTEFEIPLPPLFEQKRIVSILDKAFADIAKAKANAEQNLKNAKELFESYLQDVFENGGKKWEMKRLEQILEIERGGSPRPIQKYLTDDADGINWIKIGDTKGVDKYIYKTNQKIKPDGLKKTRLVNEGDFILSNSMSFGRPYIMKITGAIHDGWLVLRERNKNIIDKDYLYSILSSRFVFNQFDNLAAGSTVRNLNIGLVSSVSIPLPGIKEQNLIVEKLESISSQTKKLEIIYRKKLENLEQLKKSILQKALSGGL